MYKILQLTNNEANVLEKIIRIYKLPLELIQEDGIPQSDCFVDCENNQTYDLCAGVMELIFAMDYDNKKLFNETLSVGEQNTFLDLCNELGIDCSRKRVEALERAAGRIELQLPDERFKLVAVKDNSMPRHEEIDIFIEDQSGSIIQDIVRVQPKVVELTPDRVFHDKNHVTAYLYEDEHDEDYTKKVDIAIYDIDCE